MFVCKFLKERNVMDLTLIIPKDDKTIKEEINKLSEQISIRKSEIDILVHGIKHYRKFCKHKGQKTGYNERDGSWANPCPICGDCY